MAEKDLTPLGKAAQLGKYLIRYCLRKAQSRQRIVYPRVLNFPVTNKCTYRCVMCNVWAPAYSADRDMTPEVIAAVLRNPLFKEVRHVGISGGEPLIRKDLIEVIRSGCNTLPKLKGLSIITNASIDSTGDVLAEIKCELASRHVSLHVEVSIDGVGQVHDKNRGCAGAYDRTLKNFLDLKTRGLVNRISTTITRVNCNYLWEMYRFARFNGVPIDFRLASLIGRLYNQELQDNFCFSQAEKLKIIKFLENLICYYEKGNIAKQLFYSSLIGMLKGNHRRSGCDWSTSFGVSLDPYGNLYFCFPHSKPIANLRDGSRYDLDMLRKNRDKLEQATGNCLSCTHDYLGQPDLGFLTKFIYNRHVQGRLNYRHNTRVLNRKLPKPVSVIQKKVEKVSIIGWYGTETLGDKAILGAIIDNLVRDGIRLNNITVVSLHPSYTELTLQEMSLQEIKVKDCYQVKTDLSFIGSQDLFVFGGGPLCDIEPLVDMYEIFLNAKLAGRQTNIYAAGLGPLKGKRYIDTLNKMLTITDRVCFRDKLILDKYKGVISNLENSSVFIDPAASYIRNRINDINEPLIDGEYIIVGLRDWPYMYADNLSRDRYSEINSLYNRKMLEMLRNIAQSGKTVVLMPMSNYCLGDDDREYYLTYMEQLGYPKNVTLVDHDYTPVEALNYYKFAEFAVCLRFHSVVFAITCNTPCVAIDYHYGKGKISGFMSTVGLDSHVYDIDRFVGLDSDGIINKVKESHIDWEKVNSIIDLRNEQLYQFMSVRRNNES